LPPNNQRLRAAAASPLGHFAGERTYVLPFSSWTKETEDKAPLGKGTEMDRSTVGLNWQLVSQRSLIHNTNT